MNTSFWLIICLLMSFASASDDFKSSSQMVRELIEADKLFWAWAQFFFVIWFICASFTTMAYWDETSPGWRSQPTILETALVGFIAKIRSYVSANLRVTTTDSSLFDDGDESNVDTSSDTYPLTTNPGYEMPWWAPVLDHIHEVDLDKLTEDITIRQETDAKPYFEYDDMFLTLLLIPSGVDTLANADSDTSFGTYVDSSANHSTNSLSSGTAVHVESPLRLSTPKSIVNWSSKPLLSVSSEAGNAKLPAAALDSIIKDVSTPEMDTPLGKVKTSASTAAKLATAPVSRPLMHWSSTPLLSDNTLLNSTATDRSALQPSFMLTRPDAGLASAVHMHATAGIAAGATPTAALGALSSATIAAVGNKVVADEDGGDDCVGDKAVGEKDKKDEGSPVKPALAAAVTAILAGNASAANEAARASHGAQIAVPNVADKTARKNLGLLRISSNRGSLKSLSPSNLVQRLFFKRKSVTDLSSMDDSDNSAPSSPAAGSPPARSRLRATTSFKIGAQKIAKSVAPGCFGAPVTV